MTSGRAQVRRVVAILAVIAAAAAAGYVVTCAIFPAPILPKSVTVPALRGAPADSAVAWITRLGLRAKLADTVIDPLTATGTVAWQSPVAETQLPQGALVRIGVSGGVLLVSVPDVVDLDLGLARDVIQAAGLQVGQVDSARGDGDAGVVLATAPAAGATARPGDPVAISVNSGPAPVRVPDLTGLSVAAARDRLVAAGLRVGMLDQRNDGKPATIVAQNPGAGELLARDGAVNLTISGGVP